MSKKLNLKLKKDSLKHIFGIYDYETWIINEIERKTLDAFEM